MRKLKRLLRRLLLSVLLIIMAIIIINTVSYSSKQISVSTFNKFKISDDVMRHTRNQFEGGDAQAGAAVRHPEWPAYIRLLDKIDPSWKS